MTRAYVVLGARVRPDGLPSDALLRRVSAAVALWRADPLAIVVVSGGGSPHAEADVGGEVAVSLGLPRAALVLEREARDTWENARNTRALLGDGPVVVVTCSRHSFRARRAFEAHYSQVHVVPVPGPRSPPATLREGIAVIWSALRRRL